MKLTIFGATGRTGRQLTEQALAAGHEVTAVVRDPARLAGLASPRLHVLTADVLDPAAIVPAVAGADAVATAIGPRGNGPTTISQDTPAASSRPCTRPAPSGCSWSVGPWSPTRVRGRSCATC